MPYLDENVEFFEKSYKKAVRRRKTDVIENGRVPPLVGACVSSSARKTPKPPWVLNVQQA
jgi:hypothetical protein